MTILGPLHIPPLLTVLTDLQVLRGQTRPADGARAPKDRAWERTGRPATLRPRRRPSGCLSHPVGNSVVPALPPLRATLSTQASSAMC